MCAAPQQTAARRVVDPVLIQPQCYHFLRDDRSSLFAPNKQVSTLHHRLTKAPRCLERKSVDRCVVEFVRNAFHHDRDSAGRYVDLLRRAVPKKGWENVSQPPRVGNVLRSGASYQ